jgi:hypothetical protein
MQRLKLAWTLAFAVALFMYGAAYYHSWNFKDYVHQVTERGPARQQLRQALLNQAPSFGVVLQDENIDITTRNSVLRVEVGYHVPVNFLLFRHELTFRTVAAASVWVH